MKFKVKCECGISVAYPLKLHRKTMKHMLRLREGSERGTEAWKEMMSSRMRLAGTRRLAQHFEPESYNRMVFDRDNANMTRELKQQEEELRSGYGDTSIAFDEYN